MNNHCGLKLLISGVTKKEISSSFLFEPKFNYYYVKKREAKRPSN